MFWTLARDITINPDTRRLMPIQVDMMGLQLAQILISIDDSNDIR